MSNKVWDEITYAVPNLNGSIVSLGIDKQFHPMIHDGCNYLPVLVFNLIRVSERDYSYILSWNDTSQR